LSRCRLLSNTIERNGFSAPVEGRSGKVFKVGARRRMQKKSKHVGKKRKVNKLLPERRGRSRMTASVPPRTQSLVAYECIRQQILSLSLSPGAVLDERALSTELGMSRSPIREALIRLAAEGLVEAAPNRTTVVGQSDLSLSDLFSFLELQDLIYRLTARLAAQARTEQDLALLVECAEKMNTARRGDARTDFIQLNRDFHVAIGMATRNRLLAEWTRQLMDRGQRFMSLYIRDVDRGTLDQSPETQIKLIDAIRRQDLVLAEQLGHEEADHLYQRLIALWCDRRTLDVPLSRESAIK
jgi:DNA-binding GntR family transcriptional regulator